MKKTITFLAAIVISSTAISQIPNSGFETWTTVGAYNVPTGWDNLDSLTNSMSVYTCEKGTPGSPGVSFLKLTSKTFGTAVAPGIAVSGKLDMTTYMPKSGFAYTSRPANLTGSWQHMIFGTSQGSVSVLLSKWNSSTSMRDTVAFVSQTLSGMAMSWATFSIPLTYHSSAMPDSAIIVLAASGIAPTNNDYLWVDNLAFTGTVTTGVGSINDNGSSAFIYPNPASEKVFIKYQSFSDSKVKISLTDITGKTMFSTEVNAKAGINTFPIEISDFSKGIYLLNISDEDGNHVQRLVIE